MRNLPITLLCLLALTLAACTDANQQQSIPSQHWKTADVRVETHPNPPLAGMSEIVVIVTGPHGMPVGDLTISLRGADSMPWVQAIEDGNIGVYRRAIDLGDKQATTLQVKLQQGTEEKVLLFPMTLSPS
jgi:hypothetical protein